MKKKLNSGEFALILLISVNGITNLKLIAPDREGMDKGKMLHKILEPFLYQIENEIEKRNRWLGGT